jgi:hypothetical protein
LLVRFSITQRRELFIKVTINRSSYVIPLTEIGAVVQDIRELQPYDTFTMEFVPMSRAEFERMPEFGGF